MAGLSSRLTLLALLPDSDAASHRSIQGPFESFAQTGGCNNGLCPSQGFVLEIKRSVERWVGEHGTRNEARVQSSGVAGAVLLLDT